MMSKWYLEIERTDFRDKHSSTKSCRESNPTYHHQPDTEICHKGMCKKRYRRQGSLQMICPIILPIVLQNIIRYCLLPMEPWLSLRETVLAWTPGKILCGNPSRCAEVPGTATRPPEPRQKWRTHSNCNRHQAIYNPPPATLCPSTRFYLFLH